MNTAFKYSHMQDIPRAHSRDHMDGVIRECVDRAARLANFAAFTAQVSTSLIDSADHPLHFTLCVDVLVGVAK